MQFLVNVIVSGIIGGCVLATLGVGYSLFYNATRTLNLTQGAFVVLGALLTYSLDRDLGIPLWASIFLASAVVVCVAGLLYGLIIGPALARLSGPNMLIMMSGLMILLGGVATVLWGSAPVALPPFSRQSAIHVWGLTIATQGIWIVGCTIVLLIGLQVTLGRSLIGKAVRASAEVPAGAKLVGISVSRMSLLAYCGSGLLGAIGGAFLVPYNSLTGGSVLNYSLLGLVAVMLGGLGSIYGAVVGGLVLGIVEALVTAYVSTVFGGALSMFFLIAILLVRPQGLLRRTRGWREDQVGLARVPAVVVPRLPIRWSQMSIAVLVVGGALLPLFTANSSILATIDLTGVFALAAVGLDLLMGTAGQVSLGQAGFMAVGAYTASYLMVAEHVSPILAMGAGVLASVIVGLLLGLMTARSTGLYVAVVTFAFGVLVEEVAKGSQFLGGAGGITGIPGFSVAGLRFDSNERFYYLIWGLVLFSGIIVARVNRTMWGKLLRSLHADATASSLIGFNVTAARLTCFVISSVLAGVAGVLYGSYFHYLSPNMVGTAGSVFLITVVVVGGAGTVAGPIIGAGLFTFLPTITQSMSLWVTVIQGSLLALTLRYMPSGIYGGIVAAVSVPRHKRSLGVHAPGGGDDSGQSERYGALRVGGHHNAIGVGVLTDAPSVPHGGGIGE